MAGYEANLRHIKTHLRDTEDVLASVYGQYETSIMGNNSIRSGIFVATKQRLVFFAKKMVGYDLESFPYNKISSLEMSEGIMGYKISFYASGNKVKMKWIDAGDVPKFVSFVNSKISEDSDQSKNTNLDIPTQIEKLSLLMEKGLLTHEEFQNKKTELLARM